MSSILVNLVPEIALIFKLSVILVNVVRVALNAPLTKTGNIIIHFPHLSLVDQIL